MAITTADCKRFISEMHPLPSIITDTVFVTGLTDDGEWMRVRKYKIANGQVLRDFVNTSIPVVVTLGEVGTTLELVRARALFRWEKDFDARFSDWYYEDEDAGERWECAVMWPSARGSDFVFAAGNDLNHDYWMIMPERDQDGWDDHLDLDHIFESSFLAPGVLLECTYEFSSKDPTIKLTEEIVNAELIRLGFTHDPNLI